MVSFVNYVLQFKKEDNAAGDVAREIDRDTLINKRYGYRRLVSYIIDNYNPNNEVLIILEDLYHRYKVNTV